jgi:predicted glutamine amidotransferase
MCGIVGMAGDISSVDAANTFRDLLDVAQLRGRDSTGAVRVHRDGNYSYAKEIGPPAFLCDTKRYVNQIETGAAQALIGHCRAKTIGEVKRENAHPFEVPDAGIIGVHNGTLHGYYSWPEHKVGMTDSEALYHRIAAQGDEKTFAEVEGAFACVWWDQNRNTLNFIRNSERTLFFAFSADKRKVIWASEPWMLQVFSRRASGTFWTNDKGVWYWPLEERTLVRMSLAPAAAGKDAQVITYSEIKPIPHKPKTVRGGLGMGPFRNGRYVQEDGWTRNDSGVWVREGGDRLDDELPFTFGTPQTQQEGAKATQKGAGQAEQGKDGGEQTATVKESKRSTLTLPTTKPDGSVLKDQLTCLQDPIGERTPSGNTNADSSPKSSSTGLANSTALTTPTSTGLTSRVILPSRRQASGTPTPSASNVVPLNASNKPLTTQRLLAEGRFVSFRKIAGMFFITDNRTGDEHVASQLIESAGQACALCQVPIHAVKDVGAIISEKAIVCQECAHEPSNKTTILVA